MEFRLLMYFIFQLLEAFSPTGAPFKSIFLVRAQLLIDLVKTWYFNGYSSGPRHHIHHFMKLQNKIS